MVLVHGFIAFSAQAVAYRVPVVMMPALLFLICCIAAYMMGSAWGTWVLILPVALPLVTDMDLNIPLIVGAILAGVSFGADASPRGETAGFSAAVPDAPLMEHIQSQITFFLLPVGLIVLLFIVASAAA